MPDQWKGSHQIIISYRRADAATATGRIYDRLVNEFGREAVFKDVDAIPLGINFRTHLEKIISKCAAVLVVIGAKWMACDSKSGKCRLEDPRDFVRIEIESALKRDIPVIPLLVDHALLPDADSLPESLRELCNRNGLDVGQDPHFHGDITRLINNLKIIMANVPEMPDSFQKDAFDTLRGSKPLPPLPYEPKLPEGVGTAEPTTTEAEADPTEPQADKPSEDDKKIEQEVTGKEYIMALLLGMIIPSAFATAGVFAGGLLISSSAVISDMSGVLLAELGAVYALLVTGFLIGWKSRQTLWKVALLISAFSIAINLGGSLQLLLRGSVATATSFFIATAFCLLPIMPLVAYVGLHMGMRYSSSKTKDKHPVQLSQEPEKSS